MWLSIIKITFTTGQPFLEERKKHALLFDEVIARIPKRPAREVDAELRKIRRSRRKGY